ncbi:phosphotransferase family protein, partial [Pseudoalteromonas sp. S1691]
TPERTNKLSENRLDCLQELHKVDYKQPNLSHLGKGEGYTQRQITGWSERFTKAKTWNVPSGKKVIKWLENNMPSTDRLC